MVALRQVRLNLITLFISKYQEFKKLMIMKKLLFLITLTVMTVSAFGQAPQNRGERRGNFADRRTEMYKVLDLTKDQTEKVKKLDETHDAEMRKLRDDSSLDREARGKKFQELQKKWTEDFDKILTPEQQKKWKDAQEKRAKEREQRGERPQRGERNNSTPQSQN